MTLNILQQLQTDLGRDLIAFAPELLLCVTIVLLLLLRMFRLLDRLHMGYVALVFTAGVLVLSWCQWAELGPLDPRTHSDGPAVKSLDLFTGLLVYDNFTIFLKIFLAAFAGLIIWLTLLTQIPDHEDSADFHVLLLGATLGMMLMVSANHLLMIFIAIEMASLPSYAMAGFLKGRRQSSEASLKYVVYGGGAAGVMLYGMSILAGKFGTCYLPDMAQAMVSTPLDLALVLGLLFVMIGFAFKLAAVPFHFWCPDVFEGASAEVAGFLSVASKAAALALVGRFTLILAGLSGVSVNAEAWNRMIPYLVPILSGLAIITATFGNLAALPQTNLKRLLAYSTIAQAGYMLMGLATLTRDGVAAVLFYLVAYLFMNLGAFAIVAFIRNLTGSEDLADMRGLVTRAPVLVVSLGFCLLSLLGMPPLAGFAAKFQIFRVVYDAGNLYNSSAMNQPALGIFMYTMLFVLGINSVISLVYYVKVLKVMIIDQPLEEVEGQTPAKYRVPFPATVYAVLMAAALLVVGIFWDQLSVRSVKGVAPFHRAPFATTQEQAHLAGEARP